MKNKLSELLVPALAALLALSGCKATTNLKPESAADLAEEGKIVVVRPDRYVIFGTRSAEDYLRVTYSKLTDNAAGLPEVKVGLRNISGSHWWDPGSKDCTIYVQTVFYREPITGQGARTAPVFRTNKQPVVIRRGDTRDLSFVSPVKGVRDYQIIISED
ncbi:MAG: hypothetical protein PHH77_01265 [Victivallaceae bacterium]|nr:hypothetical protein [Victivallaceae bacterium]